MSSEGEMMMMPETMPESIAELFVYHLMKSSTGNSSNGFRALESAVQYACILL